MVPAPTAAILPFRPAPRAPARLLLSPPVLTGGEAGAFQDLLDSGWLAPAGPTLSRFEAEIGRGMEADFTQCTMGGGHGSLCGRVSTHAAAMGFQIRQCRQAVLAKEHESTDEG